MSELARDDQWQRLDPRMLLVHPIKELIKFLPVIVGILIARQASDSSGPWEALAIAIPIALGLLRYLTTRFRITGGRVELRRGLLNTHQLTTQIERVRTVDLTSSPIHRLLGLTTVRIGTGTASKSDDEQLDLDGLPVARARELRKELLETALSERASDESAGNAPADPDLLVERSEQVAVRFHPRWLAYAPFTTSGLVIAAGILGVGSQVLNGLDLWDEVDSVPDVGIHLAWAVLIPVFVVLLLVLVSVLAIVGYAVTNWDFSLTRSQPDGSWHLRRGLLTTRETSIDAGRIRGVSIAAPLALRLAGGRRMSAIVTGLDRKHENSAVLVPPAPAGVVEQVAASVLGTSAPLDATLVGHGPAARQRRFTRALVPALVLSALVVASVLVLDLPAWILALAVLFPAAGLFLAVDRWRSLGHALVGEWFTTRSGSLSQHRAVLQTSGIISWNLSSTWFQRRVGLANLTATTAGGSQAYTAPDLPEQRAVWLADAAVPGLVAQFLDRPSPDPSRSAP